MNNGVRVGQSEAAGRGGFSWTLLDRPCPGRPLPIVSAAFRRRFVAERVTLALRFPMWASRPGMSRDSQFTKHPVTLGARPRREVTSHSSTVVSLSHKTLFWCRIPQIAPVVLGAWARHSRCALVGLRLCISFRRPGTSSHTVCPQYPADDSDGPVHRASQGKAMDDTEVGGSLTVAPCLSPLLGPPAVRVEVHPIFRDKGHPLAAKPLLHHTGRLEVAPARQHPVAVHHAVARQVAPHRVLQRPAHDPGRPAAPMVSGNVAVGSHAAH